MIILKTQHENKRHHCKKRRLKQLKNKKYHAEINLQNGATHCFIFKKLKNIMIFIGAWYWIIFSNEIFFKE